VARTIDCPAGTRTRILHILSDSIPQSVRFAAEPVDGASAPGGTVEVERAGLFTGRRTERAPLAADNRFRKGMFDARYAVYVTPVRDTRIVFRSRHLTAGMLAVALGIVAVLGVVGGLAGYVLRWLG
jgi:hypothetical protein